MSDFNAPPIHLSALSFMSLFLLRTDEFSIRNWRFFSEATPVCRLDSPCSKRDQHDKTFSQRLKDMLVAIYFTRTKIITQSVINNNDNIVV
jgi:hypothetical protein